MNKKKLKDLTDCELCGLYLSYWDIIQAQNSYSSKDSANFLVAQEEIDRRGIRVVETVEFQDEDGELIKPVPVSFD